MSENLGKIELEFLLQEFAVFECPNREQLQDEIIRRYQAGFENNKRKILERILLFMKNASDYEEVNLTQLLRNIKRKSSAEEFRFILETITTPAVILLTKKILRKFYPEIMAKNEKINEKPPFYYCKKAEKSLKKGESLEEALSDINAALTKEPKSLEFLEIKFQILRKLGRLDEAQEVRKIINRIRHFHDEENGSKSSHQTDLDDFF